MACTFGSSNMSGHVCSHPDPFPIGAQHTHFDSVRGGAASYQVRATIFEQARIIGMNEREHWLSQQIPLRVAQRGMNQPQNGQLRV